MSTLMQDGPPVKQGQSAYMSVTRSSNRCQAMSLRVGVWCAENRLVDVESCIEDASRKEEEGIQDGRCHTNPAGLRSYGTCVVLGASRLAPRGAAFGATLLTLRGRSALRFLRPCVRSCWSRVQTGRIGYPGNYRVSNPNPPCHATSQEDPLTTRMQFRLSTAEKDIVAEQAHAAGMTLSAYCRQRILGHRVLADADATMIRELRRSVGY